MASQIAPGSIAPAAYQTTLNRVPIQALSPVL